MTTTPALPLALQRASGPAIARVLHTAPLAHTPFGPLGWVVTLEDGTPLALTSLHGRLCPWTHEEAQELLSELEESAAAVRTALERWPEAFAD